MAEDDGRQRQARRRPLQQEVGEPEGHQRRRQHRLPPQPVRQHSHHGLGHQTRNGHRREIETQFNLGQAQVLDQVDGQERNGHLPRNLVEASHQHHHQDHRVARQRLDLLKRFRFLRRNLVAFEHARSVQPHQPGGGDRHQELALRQSLPREAGQQKCGGKVADGVAQGSAHSIDRNRGAAALGEPVGQRSHRRRMEQRGSGGEKARPQAAPIRSRAGPPAPSSRVPCRPATRSRCVRAAAPTCRRGSPTERPTRPGRTCAWRPDRPPARR